MSFIIQFTTSLQQFKMKTSAFALAALVATVSAKQCDPVADLGPSFATVLTDASYAPCTKDSGINVVNLLTTVPTDAQIAAFSKSTDCQNLYKVLQKAAASAPVCTIDAAGKVPIQVLATSTFEQVITILKNMTSSGSKATSNATITTAPKANTTATKSNSTGSSSGSGTVTLPPTTVPIDDGTDVITTPAPTTKASTKAPTTAPSSASSALVSSGLVAIAVAAAAALN